MKKQLDKFIEDSRAAMTADIIRLIGFESVTGRKAAVDAALDYVLDIGRKFGMAVGCTKKHDAGYIEIGSGRECVGVLAHVDVVDVGDMQKWKYPPFEGREEEGFIWGRGSVDDKGAVVMCLYALKAIKELGLPLKKRIRLIVGTSEESEWTDIESYIAEFGMPDYGFSPDGDFPIYNAEKGYADVQLHFAEPGLSRVTLLSAGDSPNTIPSLATVAFEGGPKQEFQGRAAHSSAPEEGDNAIVRLAAGLRDSGLSFARFVNDFAVNDDLCPKLGLDDGSEWALGQKVGRTTAVPTVLRMDKEKGSVMLNINLRQKYGVSRDEITRGFQGFAEEYGYQIRIVGDFLDGMMVSSAQEPLRLMKQVYEEYGYKGEFMAAAGTSYAKSMPNFVSWGPIFRTDPNCFHVENERLSVNTMLIAAKMYACYLWRTAAEPEKTEEPKPSSLGKALSLLELFLQEPYAYTLAKAAELSGMNRTTVYRDLSAFEQAGILMRNEQTREYSLGPMAFRMGNMYLRNGNYQERLLVLLERIAEEVKESVGLARREGNKVISIYSVEIHQPVKMNDLPGEFYPMNKGCYGKCLMAYHDRDIVKQLLKGARFERSGPNTLTRAEDVLAEYDRIRENGYVLSIEENAPLIIGVGVPIKDGSGGVRNVLAVSFLKHDDYLERIESIKNTLLKYQPLVESCLT